MPIAVSAAGARLILAATALGIVLLLTKVVYLRPESLQPGDEFVVPPLVDLEGQPVSPGAREETLFVLVRADCPICRDELSELATHPDVLTERNVRILSLSGWENTRDIVGQGPTRRWTVVDGGNGLEARYGRFLVPTVLLVSRRGRILAKTRGRMTAWNMAAFAFTTPAKAPLQ